jgi:hypothetical protein
MGEFGGNRILGVSILKTATQRKRPMEWGGRKTPQRLRDCGVHEATQ